MADRPIIGAEHAWFRARFDAHALGLLDEAETVRFDAHAQSCAACGAALRTYTQNPARIAREGHIPAGIIARWDRASSKLRGMARRMVREHLENCVECRQDLEAIGFRPELARDPALEGEEEPDPAADPAPAAFDAASRAAPPLEPSPKHTIRIVQAPPRRWMQWLIGGGAGAVLATAAALLIVPTIQPPAPPQMDLPTPSPSVLESPASAPEPRFVLDLLVPPQSLRGTLRGATGEPTIVQIEPGARFVQLSLPDLFLSDTTTVSLRFVSPDGADVLETRHRYDALTRRRTLLFGNPTVPLTSGDYRLVVSAPFANEPVVAEFRFRLENRP